MNNMDPRDITIIMENFNRSDSDSKIVKVTVKRASKLSGAVTQLTFKCTLGQLKRYLEGAEYVQNIFPEMLPEIQEFLISGITKDE
jgi:hypothetical protein